jgi:predicted ATPase
VLTELKLQNFKSWQDTGMVRLAPLTGLFGSNSSGKTSLLQFLLLLKQTVESPDRSRVLHTGGDERSYVDLGTFYDLVYKHKQPGQIHFWIAWTLPKPLRIADPERASANLFRLKSLRFSAKIRVTADQVQVERLRYTLPGGYNFGMQLQAEAEPITKETYDLFFEGYDLKRTRGRKWPLPPPVKSYGFPDQVNAYYQNAGFLSEFVLAFEELFHNIFYLGPLREYPSRSYVWAGERPQDVGRRGQSAVPALLASQALGKVIRRGRGRPRQTVEERVAEWLKDLGLIHSFTLQPIAKNRKDYEVRVRRSPYAAEVLITDVGFGVSQILPVLVLCYYAPEGSTIILEQPEIHLHPAVQAGLADVFIDAINTRKIQIILESHSEHLLRRLQRRIAEASLQPGQAALYFTAISNGKSQLEELELDQFGNITNWPPQFFGDELGDLTAMAEAAMRRSQTQIPTR